MLIVFDLDDTLIDTSGVVTPYKLRQLVHYLVERKHIPIESLESACGALLALNQTVPSSQEAVRQTLSLYGLEKFSSEIFSFYKSLLPVGFQVPTTPNAKEIIKTLLDKHYILALVTGGDTLFQLQKLELAGLEKAWFSKILIPNDSNKKPCYEALLQEFALEPGKCWVIGDRVAMDLMPARELGFQTVHMRWGRGMLEKDHCMDHSINNLSELLRLL